MRDPLSWVSVKYKLPLSFIVIGLVAFGIGGVVVTSTAGEALDEQIRLRLDGHAKATTSAIERGLDLVGRRIEDFASDGFIRAELAELTRPGADAELHRERLVRHLRENKLSLTDAFVDAMLVDADGAPIVRVDEKWEPPAASLAAESTWFGPLRDTREHPSFLLATPVRSLDGARRIGTLQLVVDAGAWIAALDRLPHVGLRHMALVDPRGRRLPMHGTRAEGDVISYTAPIARNGWRLDLAVDRAEAMRPITRLRRRYLLLGGVLLLLTAAVCFFPVRFLLRPLTAIRDGARRIARGDFEARVTTASRDEIGDLAEAFNIMAQAVQERTGKLERAAETLARREADIRVERDRLDAVLRSMQDGVFVIDNEKRVTLANAAAAPLVELFQEKSGVAPIDCPRSAGDATACFDCLTDVSTRHRNCLVEADDRVFEIRAVTRPGMGRICVSRDVTERIATQERQSHQERLSVLGEISAVMAHELNNPLAAITMFSQMLESQLTPGDPSHESAAVIRRNAETCKQTIRGLLDMAASAASEPQEFDLVELFEELSVFLRPLYQRADVRFDVGWEGDDPLLVGDELQLRQALINLVMNAVQAMGDTGGTVTLAARGTPERVRMVVRDTGPGIPDDVLEHIFQAFFSTKPAGVGTGLGLPTSRRIVEAHGGTLQLLETGPAGTAFEIVLPRQGARAAWQARARMTAGFMRERFGAATEAAE